MTPNFLLRSSCCPRKLLVAFHVAVPVKGSVNGSMRVIFENTAVFPKKNGQPVPGLELGSLRWSSPPLDDDDNDQ